MKQIASYHSLIVSPIYPCNCTVGISLMAMREVRKEVEELKKFLETSLPEETKHAQGIL
jgi:hypothetical protein